LLIFSFNSSYLQDKCDLIITLQRWCCNQWKALHY